MTNQLTIAGDGNFQGFGAISVNNDGRLSNNATLRVSGGLLTLTTPFQFGLPALDLDGDNEDGDLDVSNGDMLVKRSLTDVFDAQLTIATTRTATFERNWQLGPNGLIRMTGSNDIATLDGNQVTVHRCRGPMTHTCWQLLFQAHSLPGPEKSAATSHSEKRK